MKRTASLVLDWKRCPYDFAEYEAQLPEIPGYPGTGDGNALAYIAPKGGGYIFWLTVAVTYDDVATLTNKDFGISSSDSSVDMERAVESLSVEEIADALQTEGYAPGGIATAARKADKRTASLNLDWSDQGIPQYEEAPLTFDIPGYEYDHAHSDVAITNQFMDPTFGFAFDIAGLKCPRGDYAQLWNDVDFGIPNGKTVEEMMQAAENITPQEIADALAAKRYAPDDDMTAARKADKREAHLDLHWKPNIDATTYTAILPDIPGYRVQNPSNWGDHCVQVYSWGDGWQFDITLVLPHSMDTPYLTNDDFGIPNTETADEMMQAVDNLSMDDIVFVLKQWGFLPGDGD